MINQISNKYKDYGVLDFLKAFCNSLKPIKAIKAKNYLIYKEIVADWKRVVKIPKHRILSGTYISGVFNHNRPGTTIEHLIDDVAQNKTEKDLLDQEISKKSHCNYINRCLHHRVFIKAFVAELIDFLNLKIKSGMNDYLYSLEQK